jgi:meiotic recombination protein SPO11
VTARVLSLVHELCRKNIHVTKRDLFYTDVRFDQPQPEVMCEGPSTSSLTYHR